MWLVLGCAIAVAVDLAPFDLASQPSSIGIIGPIRSPINNHDYYLTDRMGWPEAEDLAVEMGGHLATIRSDEENDWILKTFGPETNDDSLWIGFNDIDEEGTWVWSSGEPVGYTNWAPGEPSGSGDFGDFAVEAFHRVSPGEWNDGGGLQPSVIEVSIGACCRESECQETPHFECISSGCMRIPEWTCDGDVDGDGQVNPVDVGQVQANFGNTVEQALCNYDIDCDGQINPVDSGIVQSLMGTCNEPRVSCGTGVWFPEDDCESVECP